MEHELPSVDRFDPSSPAYEPPEDLGLGSARAPTGQTGIGDSILDRITGTITTIAQRGIENIAAQSGITGNSRQGPTGRGDIYAGGEPRFTINIGGVALPLKEGQMTKAAAGQPFNLTLNQRNYLARAGVNIGLAASRGITLSNIGGQAVAMRGGQALQLQNQSGGGGVAEDDNTPMLYFALAAGIVLLFVLK